MAADQASQEKLDDILYPSNAAPSFRITVIFGRRATPEYAKAVALVLPQLKGKLTGYSLRVPTPTVSVVDFSVITEKKTTAEAVNAALKAASEGVLKGILGFEVRPLVSVDYKGCPISSVVDAALTLVINENHVKVVAWYDNEMGYSYRLVDLCNLIGKSL